MERYWSIFVNGYQGYARYFWQEVTHPHWHNYFYWLIAVSAFFFAVELLAPWRKNQARFRKDFWLDFFYLFFNFFLFSLLIYNAASLVVVTLLNDCIKALSGFDLQASNPLRHAPVWAILLLGFVVRDFIQWWVHRLLHRSDWLWEFHKVHHSVEEMGFAAHLRYHWMENVVYRSIEYIPLALLGVGLYDFFVIHIFTLAVGHYNHSNIRVSGSVSGAVVGGLVGLVVATGSFELHILTNPTLLEQALTVSISFALGAVFLGPIMKFLFNSPEMHIWHHAYEMPPTHRFGINFGITLAIWDYIFKTAYQPYEGRDIRLGFDDMEQFPKDFLGQNLHGIGKAEVNNPVHH